MCRAAVVTPDGKNCFLTAVKKRCRGIPDGGLQARKRLALREIFLFGGDAFVIVIMYKKLYTKLVC